MTIFPTLTWFRKPFGPGDTDGSGAQKLLGQPELTIAELLVREAAQNSWDAAIGSEHVPEFQMRYRELSEDVLSLLRRHVFSEVHEASDLAAVLRREALDAVEVIDRGTRGLGGPIRNDRAVSSDQITDYSDFVLTVGAPPDHAHGGGTYGYGKTASYMASSCSTIIIWSRARDRESGALVERFIASAMDETFTDAQGMRFTGRQWWGVRPEDAGDAETYMLLDPASGADARRLGEAIFERHFEGDETGTSLLILAPRPVDEATSLVDSWANAIDQNLWPKMIKGQDPKWTMHISLVDRGEPVMLGTHSDPQLRRARESCLEAVRSAQAGEPVVNPLIRMREIRHGTHRVVLGHLAMTKVLGVADEGTETSAVTYMRNKAELVVCDDSLGMTSGDGRWVAVFKPVEATDRAFAKSEPPAHDAWNPRGMTDAKEKSFVNVALRNIKREISTYLRPGVSSAAPSEQKSTGRLSVALGSLVLGVTGNRALPGQGRRTTKRAVKQRRSRSPKVEIIKASPMSATAADTAMGRQRLLVRLENPGDNPIEVKASRLAIAVDGRTGVDPHEVDLAQWVTEGVESTEETVILPPGQVVDAHITSPQGVAVEFSFSAEEVS